MRTIAFLPAGVALIALLVSLAPLATSHGVEIEASGTFIPGPLFIIPVEEEANLCVFEAIAQFSLTGTLEGSAIQGFTAVQQAPCAAMGVAVTFEGTGAFVGDLVMPDGTRLSGTFGFELEGGFDAVGNLDVQVEIESGTGALADLDGELTFTGNVVTGPVIYTGQLELDDDDD